MMVSDQQLYYMQCALDLAYQGLGRTAPNPAVGAVIVKDGEIVGRGFHPRAGEPHAEVFALRDAGARARDADVYVTLEPCSHYGKTPPCAEALVAAGVKRVFVGVTDPNPRVAGAGIALLEKAGIDVLVGVQEEQCRRLIAPFKKHILSGLPFTIYKTAMTLDGATATWNGDSKWVSSAASRRHVHHLRDRVEAIMVGIETVLHDDPLLNTRLDDGVGRDPLRVVVDSRLRMPPNSRMLRQSSAAATLIATGVQDTDKIRRLEEVGAEILVLPLKGGKVFLPALWRELGRRQVQRLLLEGGATLATAALQERLIDQLMLFAAPKILGGLPARGIFAGPGCDKMAAAEVLTDIRFEQIENDLLITGDLNPCLPD